jgi:hypothetical protein
MSFSAFNLLLQPISGKFRVIASALPPIASLSVTTASSSNQRERAPSPQRRNFCFTTELQRAFRAREIRLKGVGTS